MKLALGTAQFGLNYGITNTEGKVQAEEVGNILEIARESKIDTIDTAIAYGTSEATLGLFDLSNFKLISKIPSLEHDKKVELKRLVEGSLGRLKIDKLYGLMLHREQDAIERNSDKIFEQLFHLKEIGLIEKVGVSFYSPDIASELLKKYSIDIIQVPASQLDNRFMDDGIMSLANDLSVELHVRSIFLQGLLTTPESKRPSKFKGHKDLRKFDEQAKLIGISLKELALRYLFQREDISKGVIGCINAQQFVEVISAYKKLESQKITDLELSSKDIELINPSLW